MRAMRASAVAVVAAAFLAAAAAPASALVANVGGGVATATFHYSPGIPPVGDECVPTTFTVAGRANPFTLTTASTGIVVSGYGGPLDFSGTGSSSCDSASNDGGSITLTATGDHSVSCPNLTGTYTRVATDFLATLGGICTINGVPSSVGFLLRGELVPTNTGGGTTTPITDAQFTGAVGVTPT